MAELQELSSNYESNNHQDTSKICKFRLPERDLKEFWFERDGKKLIKCIKFNCDAVLKSKKLLLNHIEKDHKGKPYSCGTCLESFRLKGELYEHSRSTHGLNLHKNLKCHLCDHVTVSQRYLKLHIATVHEGQRPYSCKHCDKSFASKKGLKTHNESIHENKKHICEICGASFSQNDTLKNHIKKIHEKSIPKESHLCNICGKDYPLKLSLDMHIRRFHEGKYDKNYQCDMCAYACTWRYVTAVS